MKLIECLLLGALLALPATASAHGPTPQKVEEKIEIAAPPDKVWAVVKEFGAISTWHPGVKESKGHAGNEAGGERIMTLKGGQLTESLDEYLDKDMTYSYRVVGENMAAMPVSFYSATLQVKPGKDGGSEVEWISRFYRGDTGNFPPENLNDAAAIAAMSGFIKEGLAGLKATAEKK
jgi:mxaD protein